MLSFSSAQIEIWLASAIWPFARIFGLLLADPTFGHRAIPMRIKIALAMALSIVLVPIVGPFPEIHPGSAAGLLVLVQQLVIGASIGFALRIVFAGVELAGRTISMQMGFEMGLFYEPQWAPQVPVLGHFLLLLGGLFFFAIDGHLLLISILSESFRVFPIGADQSMSLGARMLFESGGVIFLYAFMLALPIIAALLLTHLTLGILSRGTTQFDMFGVGLPLSIGVGLLMFALLLPALAPVLERFFTTTLENLPVLLQTTSER